MKELALGLCVAVLIGVVAYRLVPRDGFRWSNEDEQVRDRYLSVLFDGGRPQSLVDAGCSNLPTIPPLAAWSEGVAEIRRSGSILRVQFVDQGWRTFDLMLSDGSRKVCLWASPFGRDVSIPGSDKCRRCRVIWPRTATG